MVGQLSDISPVEISQMINSNQKTGYLEVEAEYISGKILFNEGDVVKVSLGLKKGIEGFYDFLALQQGCREKTQTHRRFHGHADGRHETARRPEAVRAGEPLPSRNFFLIIYPALCKSATDVQDSDKAGDNKTA